MRNRLFDPDGGLMISLTQLTDCIFLSLFFILGSIPLLTSGAALSALYDSAFRAYRKAEKHSWGRFLHSFRGSLRASVLPTIVLLAALWLLLKAEVLLWNGAVAGELSWMLFSALSLMCVLALGVLSLIFPLISRFELSFPVLMKNTLLLSLANLPRVLGLGLLSALTLYLCLRYVVPVFFLPALSALLSSFLIEPIFAPYMSAQEEEAE